MWQPTHVQVTVQRAKGLLFKGKNETNDAFVVIALGKEKFQTSIKERAGDPVEWHEECDLEIPTQGNTAAVQLTVYHRNALGMDEFLGQKSLPLAEFDVYERPRTRSYKLQSKPDKSKKKAEKERGELEAKIAFIVKSGDFLDVGKKEKHKSSLTSLKHMGGSLLSLGNKDKHSLKKFTKSVSNRMDKIVPKKKRSNKSDDSLPPQLMASSQWAGQADPGVISDEDEDDLAFDDVKVSSTVNSSPYSTVSRASSRHLPRLPDEDSLAGTSYSGVEESPVARYGPTRPSIVVGSLERLSGTGGGGGSSRSSLNNSCTSSTHDLHQQYSPAVSDHYAGGGTRFPEVKALTLDRSLKLPTFEENSDSGKKHKRKGLKSRLFSKGTSSRVEEEGRVVEGGNDKLPNAPPSNPHSRLSQDIHNKFAGKSREDLMEQILTLQSVLERQVRHSRDLEEYIDNLLLRVLDASPHILQAPTTPQPTSSLAHRPKF